MRVTRRRYSKSRRRSLGKKSLNHRRRNTRGRRRRSRGRSRRSHRGGGSIEALTKEARQAVRAAPVQDPHGNVGKTIGKSGKKLGFVVSAHEHPETKEISYKVIHAKPKEANALKAHFNQLKNKELNDIISSEFTPTPKELRQAKFQASVKMNDKGVVKHYQAVHNTRLPLIYT